MLIHNALGSSEAAYRLGWTVIHSLWEGAALAVVAALILAALPRRAASARHLALITALFAMLAAWAITFMAGPAAGSMPIGAGPSHLPTMLPSNSGTNVAQVSALAADPQARARSLPIANDSGRLWEQWAGWLRGSFQFVARLWMAGVVLLALWRAGGWLSAQRLRVIQTEPADASVLQMAQRLARRLHLSRRFEILISHLLQTPMVIGWLRPVILIPAAAASGLASWQLEGILAHELAHIRRHDYLMNLLQVLAETLLFYHPAVWWISRQVRLEREQACDDVALGLCLDPHEYAQSLAALEELRLVYPLAMAANGSGGGQLIARIRRILGPGDDAPRWGVHGIFSLLALVACAAVVFSQERTSPAAGPSTQPFVLHNDAPKLSPFTAVRWHGDVPQVKYQGEWYELVAINDVPPATILDYLKQSHDFNPQKHYAEDLVEVMRDFGNPVGDTVKLDLKTLDTAKPITIAAAAMTEANRRSVLTNGNPGIERGMPFSAVRWHDQAPEIFVNGKWCELVAVNALPAAQIVGFAQGWAARDDWQRRFAEDFPDILTAMGQPAGAVDLTIRTLDTHGSSTLKNVPMNPEYRALNMFGVSPGDPGFREVLSAGTQTLFSAVRWGNDAAQVQINGNDTWYDLVGVDNLTAAQIYDFARKTYGEQWQQHLAEHSVQIIKQMGDVHDNVMLQLRTLDTHEDVALLKRLWPGNRL